MISPISIATRGRISTSVKKTLTVAVIGWLVIVGGGGGGGGVVVDYPVYKEGGSHNYDGRNRENILREDDEIFHLLKIWVECHG